MESCLGLSLYELNIYLSFCLLADDLIDVPAGMVSPGTKFRVIDNNRSCENNKEKITRFHSQRWIPLSSCRMLCLAKKKCRAFDYYKSTWWCNLYERPCITPLETKDSPSSHEVVRKGCAQAGSGDGMIGILGSRRKYVCNALQAVRAHLSNVSDVSFDATVVLESDHRFWQDDDTRRVVTSPSEIKPRTKRAASRKRRRKLSLRPHPRTYRRAWVNTSQHQQSSMHRRRVFGPRQYALETIPRPGRRCLLARRRTGWVSVD